MKEPFPIIGDSKADIETFKETYKNYNEYYVPVTSINCSDKNETLVLFYRRKTTL